MLARRGPSSGSSRAPTRSSGWVEDLAEAPGPVVAELEKKAREDIWHGSMNMFMIRVSRVDVYMMIRNRRYNTSM